MNHVAGAGAGKTRAEQSGNARSGSAANTVSKRCHPAHKPVHSETLMGVRGNSCHSSIFLAKQ